MRENKWNKVKRVLRILAFWHKYDCCDYMYRNCKRCCKKYGFGE